MVATLKRRAAYRRRCAHRYVGLRQPWQSAGWPSNEPDAVLQRPAAAAIVDRNCFSSACSAQKPAMSPYLCCIGSIRLPGAARCERRRVAHRKRSIAS